MTRDSRLETRDSRLDPALSLKKDPASSLDLNLSILYKRFLGQNPLTESAVSRSFFSRDAVYSGRRLREIEHRKEYRKCAGQLAK